MARGAGIDPEELFDAANRLEADGKEVTALSLLNALGRGSLTTIYKHLEDWKKAKPTQIAVGNSEIPEAVRNAFAGTWRVAALEAAREVSAVKEKAAEEVKDAIRQFHGALEAIEKLEKESDADALEIENFKKLTAEQQAEISRLEADSAGQKATVEQLSQQVQAQQTELDRLHKEIERERTERDAAIKEASELTGRAELLQAQNEKLIAKLTSSKEQE